MTEHPAAPEGEDAHEAGETGEKPDLGRKPDAMNEALSGTNVGSDTVAGSLRGGSASGSDIDPDQEAIDEMLATEGMAAADQGEAPSAPPGNDESETVRNTGEDEGADPEPGEPSHPKRGEADAATG